ncbi:MAG: alpha/beta fold hydrolase [Thermomicrobiales bacterium]
MSAPNVEMFERDGGRKVAIHRIANGDTGRTIVFCHPAPGSGAFDPLPEQTEARGVTLLAVDRPGYGQSDPIATGEWASVGSAADDLAAVIAQLGVGPVGVAGWSAGGRVALALAARHPDLVDRAVVIGTPAPYAAVPWIPRPFRGPERASRPAARGGSHHPQPATHPADPTRPHRPGSPNPPGRKPRR